MENSAVISHILISSRQEPQPGCQVFKPSWTPFKDAEGTFFQCGGTHLWNPLTQHCSGRKLPLCSCGQKGFSSGQRYPIYHVLDQPGETNNDHTQKFLIPVIQRFREILPVIWRFSEILPVMWMFGEILPLTRRVSEIR